MIREHAGTKHIPMTFDSDSHEPGEPIPESGNWLVDIIHYCLANNLCTRINCTTCGATEYRHVYLATAASKLGLNPRKRPNLGNWILRDRKKILQLVADELKNIHAEHIQKLANSGIKLLIQDLYYMCPKNELDLPTLLSDSPAGKVLQSMIAHHNSRIEEARRHEEYVKQVRKNREIARQLHQENLYKSFPGSSVPDSPKDIWVKSVQEKLRDLTPDQRLLRYSAISVR